MNTEHVHIRDRPQGVVEPPQTQAVRAAGQQGGLLSWESASIAYERFLNNGYLKQDLERNWREKSEEHS